MRTITPEAAGISSRHVLSFVQALEAANLSTHSVLMARGDAIFTESYYAPFHRDFKHRMYSVSKTFVSMAIGFCEQEGLLCLDDPMSKYLPEYLSEQTDPRIRTVTIREMLKMETSFDGSANWFARKPADRTAVYFDLKSNKNANCLFAYDSSGSYMLGVIVERLMGKDFLKALQERVLDRIGFSRDAYCLTAPGGFAWGDSGVMCTSRDLLLFARFVLNGGAWNGEQILSADYVRKATDTSVCNNDYGFLGAHNSYGYGYQIWGMADGCFAMLGMGNQLAFCSPKHDFIFVITSDNQGNPHGYETILSALHTHIMPNLGAPMAEDQEAHAALSAFTADRRLFFLDGPVDAPIRQRINGKTFRAAPNPMGITSFSLRFEGDGGVFAYENATGKKELPFGLGRNAFGKFPEEGYSDLIGTVYAPGNKYDCAVSADFPEPSKLRIRVQIIDKYFGNLAIVFGFRDENTVTVRMVKCAEAFLDEYEGLMDATAE